MSFTASRKWVRDFVDRYFMPGLPTIIILMNQAVCVLLRKPTAVIWKFLDLKTKKSAFGVRLKYSSSWFELENLKLTCACYEYSSGIHIFWHLFQSVNDQNVWTTTVWFDPHIKHKTTWWVPTLFCDKIPHPSSALIGFRLNRQPPSTASQINSSLINGIINDLKWVFRNVHKTSICN
jgi:hypothetical protein